MKAKQTGALLLAVLMAVLSSCGTKAGGPSGPSSVEAESPAYPWMAGESPIPDRHVGLSCDLEGRQGGFACTETGYYIVGEDERDNKNYIFYGDYGSDTLVKLCGRPDCDHLNEDCNARFDSCDSVYYDGSHLFVNEAPFPGKPRVIRMDLDGSNQEVVLDLADFVTSQMSFGNYYAPHISNGVFFLCTTRLDESGNRVAAQIYYKLDGSMEEPAVVPGSLLATLVECDSDGNFVDSHYYETVRVWDPETGEVHELTENRGSGYYGMEEAWYIKDGVICHLNYASGEEEALLDTGILPGEDDFITLLCFPDCLVLHIQHQPKEHEDRRSTFYFYNWAMEPVGDVTIQGSWITLCGETEDRLIFNSDYLPWCYVDKADFGTGHIELHEFNMPDMDWDAIQAAYQETLGN